MDIFPSKLPLSGLYRNFVYLNRLTKGDRMNKTNQSILQKISNHKFNPHALVRLKAQMEQRPKRLLDQACTELVESIRDVIRIKHYPVVRPCA